MREWKLSSGDPLVLALTNDARVGPVDYADDHIWEVSLERGEPPGVAVQTTFGLRARSFRILPRFIQGDLAVTDPALFSQPPSVHKLYPNLLSMRFSPFPLYDVNYDLWVPESHLLVGSLEMSNHRQANLSLRLEILCLLAPTSGSRMAASELQAARILSGKSEELYPVLLMTSSPEFGSGSYPSLALNLELAPGESRQVSWILAVANSPEASLELARRLAARNWEAEQAYVNLLNAGQVEIYTGDPDWDAAFMLSQKTAFSLLMSASKALPNLSFILNRLPDQGFSLRGDGSDYSHTWNGQTPLDSYYLLEYLLPGSTEIAKGILRNFIFVQAEDGRIDWKPGLAGQRSRILATPLLSYLAWRIYETSQDKAFLGEIFPALLKFTKAWFQPEQDRDSDGIPEWDHLSQVGIEDHPFYSRWQEWSEGIEINSAESPALCAFLYQECQSLIQMAEVLGFEEPIEELQATAERLRLAVEIAWDGEKNCYQYVDRETHFSSPGRLLAERNGSGILHIYQKFDQPVRLVIQIHSQDENTRRTRLAISGASATGQPRLETILEDRMKWSLGWGMTTGERVYQQVDTIEVSGLSEGDLVRIITASYDQPDLTCFLPLWARISEPERAAQMIENSLLNPQKFWHGHGLPTSPVPGLPIEGEVYTCTNLVWNLLIGQGLLAYGYREEAARLFNNLMKGILRSLKEQQAFRRYYQVDTGQGRGERNPLQGLAPVSLFLECIGLRLISPRKVLLNGFNPFPWPVTVKYRGLTILCVKDKSTVIFPDGQAITIDDPAPRVVSLEAGLENQVSQEN